MTVNERDRVVAPAQGLELAAGDEGARGGASGADRASRRVGRRPASGSRLSGTVAQIVYLGTLTQFHVDTSAERRFIVHQLSSDASDTIDEGDEVTLTWPVDDTSILTVGANPGRAPMQ